MPASSITNQTDPSFDITERWCPSARPALRQEESGNGANHDNTDLSCRCEIPLPLPFPDCPGDYASTPYYQTSGLLNRGYGFIEECCFSGDATPTEEQGNDGSVENVFFGENDDDGLVADDDDGDDDCPDDDDDDPRGRDAGAESPRDPYIDDDDSLDRPDHPAGAVDDSKDCENDKDSAASSK